ncbi:hypothetical protein [Paenibacillus sp. JDR-2]|uniref:hypothetical protein n=1 Tax=Paenibacillus sp. (strain JDR-2) TaxID=324057 RepID=UPI0001664359|nr:hypothetical protein [Paenibacillus sp. JDR-2]ACT01536.1 hypothetical protein Pjdr2_2888 [Paenibacillus sp. JDR-2]
MKAMDIFKSISIGLLIAVFALGLLPFLVVFSLADMYGVTENYEWMEAAPLWFLFPRKNKNKEKDN